MNIKQDFIPKSNRNRPGTKITPTYITEHETANTSKGAGAATHARYVKGQNAIDRSVSWHYTVDHKEIIQHLPDNEMGWHAGATGNRQSIGIELCVNSDGDFNKAKANAAWLVRHLMAKHNIPITRVVSHQFWTGKNCPANLLKEWGSYIALISNTKSAPTAPQVKPVTAGGEESHVGSGTVRVKASELWVYDNKDWSARYQKVKAGEVFTVVAEHTVSGSKMLELLSGLFITANSNHVTYAPDNKKGTVTKGSGTAVSKISLPNVILRAVRPFPHGANVRAVQEALASAYFYPDKGAKNNGIDGVYGPKTADAVRRFQEVNGLAADGVYGPATRAKLLSFIK
ncbi:peptidoglycan recognition protein family protein [Alkalicoccobacillus gibsonii]|uniref:peptidoglycan recognition protein family protein n=1 Tax=Alkalicoccobacillus gibsonii TaxID=79881 RepID=UPI0019336016|nr:N-acetylmuramoyl-L-alanine amidase [Alkalicoccobacillus gibsonii]MBM0064914.1 N-acetylmuramoyl-L-alanine amidase [Alkalicoccobacillus gibsonii]